MTLSPRLARAFVLAPTLVLSLVLGNHGYAPLPRLAACLGLAAMLIAGLTFYRHRRSAGEALGAAMRSPLR